MGPNTAVFLTIALIAHLLAYSPCAAESIDRYNGTAKVSDKPTPSHLFRLGQLTIETYFNQSEHREKLRLKKSTLKVVMSNNVETAFVSKLTLLEELVRCDNVTLRKPEMKDNIDCLPLNHFLSPEDPVKVPSPSSKLYALRRSLRLKSKSRWWSSFRRETFVHFYELDDLYVDQLVDDKLHELNLHSSIFSKEKSDRFGAYFEVVLTEGGTCHGIYAAALKRKLSPPGEIFEQLMDDWKFDLTEEILVTLPHYVCSYDIDLMTVGLESPITVVWQPQQFPYLTVQHSIRTTPTDIFWNYSGDIRQFRDESKPKGAGHQPTAYNTLIKLSSASMFGPLNFHLNQTFVHEDLKKGWEEMVASSPHFVAMVKGIWDEDSLVKVFRLFSPKDGSKDLASELEVSYSDEPKENDFVMLAVKMGRKFIKTLEELGGSLAVSPSPSDADDQKSEEAPIYSSAHWEL